MKILIVSSFFPLHCKDEVPQFLLEQVSELASCNPNAEIVVLASSRHGGVDENIAANVQVRRFSYFYPIHKQNLTILGILPAIKKSKWNLFQIPLLFAFEYFAIVKELKRFKPDYIYSHWFLPQGLLCYWLAKRFQIPHVFTSHSSDVEICKRAPFIGPKMVRSAIYSMKAVTVVSQRTLQGISQFFDKDEWLEVSKKIKIIPMGITLPLMENKISISGTKDAVGLRNKKMILFMGRFVEKKGIFFLLKAMTKLLEIDRSIVLVLAGDGILKDEIEQMVRDLDLVENVVFPGFITDKEKDDFLRIADVYVLPSIEAEDGDREGLPVSLLESMSYGNVCVATNESSAGEVIVSGKNGFLCASGDSGELFKKIVQAIGLNEQQRELMVGNARETASHYSWPKIIKKQMEHLFQYGS